jgi:hypothetical protein
VFESLPPYTNETRAKRGFCRFEAILSGPFPIYRSLFGQATNPGQVEKLGGVGELSMNIGYPKQAGLDRFMA